MHFKQWYVSNYVTLVGFLFAGKEFTSIAYRYICKFSS